MTKNKRLDEIQAQVFTYIWLNGTVICSRDDISKQLNLPLYTVSKVLDELHEKRWIKKQRCGRGIRLDVLKKDVPNYIIPKAELFLCKYVS